MGYDVKILTSFSFISLCLVALLNATTFPASCPLKFVPAFVSSRAKLP